MHRMVRSSVKLDANEKLIMFCEHCDDFVHFYASGNKVRCAHALKSYYRKSASDVTHVDDESADVPTVLATNDFVELYDYLQAGHCALCESYVRLSRDGTRKNLFVVPVSGDNLVPGLFCWDCRTYLMNRMRDAFDAKAVGLLSKDPVNPLDLRPEPDAGRENGDSDG